MSYVDEHVGAIVAALRDGGKYDESIVVFQERARAFSRSVLRLAGHDRHIAPQRFWRFLGASAPLSRSAAAAPQPS